MISMTSSIQLATEIQQTEPPPDPAEVDNQNQTIEGIELIARTLDSSKYDMSKFVICLLTINKYVIPNIFF